MGLEAKCSVVKRIGKETTKAGTSTVLWEGDALIVRGDARVRVPRGDITSIAVKGDALTVAFANGSVALELGAPLAAKWREKMLAPVKSRLTKLGIAAETRVAVLGVRDDTLADELEAIGAVVSTRVSAKTEVVLLGVNSEQDLPKIERIAGTMARDAALWAVHPKGVREVADTVIFAEAKRAGLTYTKVASFSDTLTAEKLVFPVANR